MTAEMPWGVAGGLVGAGVSVGRGVAVAGRLVGGAVAVGAGVSVGSGAVVATCWTVAGGLVGGGVCVGRGVCVGTGATFAPRAHPDAANANIDTVTNWRIRAVVFIQDLLAQHRNASATSLLLYTLITEGVTSVAARDASPNRKIFKVSETLKVSANQAI